MGMKLIKRLADDAYKVQFSYLKQPVVLTKKQYWYFKYNPKAIYKPVEYEIRTRNVMLDEVDEDYAIILEEYCYDNGEPNGWARIQYAVNSYGKVLPVELWHSM
jgi:hypothetical protein